MFSLLLLPYLFFSSFFICLFLSQLLLLLPFIFYSQIFSSLRFFHFLQLCGLLLICFFLLFKLNISLLFLLHFVLLLLLLGLFGLIFSVLHTLSSGFFHLCLPLLHHIIGFLLLFVRQLLLLYKIIRVNQRSLYTYFVFISIFRLVSLALWIILKI